MKNFLKRLHKEAQSLFLHLRLLGCDLFRRPKAWHTCGLADRAVLLQLGLLIARHVELAPLQDFILIINFELILIYAIRFNLIIYKLVDIKLPRVVVAQVVRVDHPSVFPADPAELVAALAGDVITG